MEGRICAGNEAVAEELGNHTQPPGEIEGSFGNANRDSVDEVPSTKKTKKKKKMVKKMVKVMVKKVVKRKVLMLVRKGATSCSNKELKKMEVIEFGDERIDSDSRVSLPVQEVENMISFDKEDLLNGVDGETSGVVEEVGKFDSLVSETIGDGNPELGSRLSMEEAENPIEIENSRVVEVYEEGKESSLSEIQMIGIENEDVVEKYNDASEMPVESVSADLVGDSSDDCGWDEVVIAGSEDEGGKEAVEICTESNVENNGGLLLSGEMEALERRRRRKTEIFIGGLNTIAKEEDVRKAFEEVGEVVEVRVIYSNSGKNRGYAFVRFASAAEAKKALEKHSLVEICGKQCSIEPAEGNDTIYLGNIDRKWKSEDVIKLLRDIGIEKIDKITVMADPSNAERNRGFAFLELETNKDAQIAFKKLQTELLGRLQKLKVAWAKPLSEPDEEEFLKVKSVYVEFLPPSWDEEEVRNYFRKFGEIENVVLAQNLHSSRRKDFAFINFTTRQAALLCVESFNSEVLNNEGTKVNVKVSLAKPMPKDKKKVSKSTREEFSTKKVKAAQRPARQTVTRNKEVSTIKIVNHRKGLVNRREPRNKGESSIRINNDRTGSVRPTQPQKNKGASAIQTNNDRTADTRSLGTADLEQMLAERALQRQTQARLGLMNSDYSSALPGTKRSFSALVSPYDNVYHLDPRGYSRMRVENSFPVGGPSHGEIPSLFGMTSHYHHEVADYALDYRHTNYANNFQREMPSQRSSSLQYRRIM